MALLPVTLLPDAPPDQTNTRTTKYTSGDALPKTGLQSGLQARTRVAWTTPTGRGGGGPKLVCAARAQYASQIRSEVLKACLGHCGLCPLCPQKRTLHCTAANVRLLPKADILHCGRDWRYSMTSLVEMCNA